VWKSLWKNNFIFSNPGAVGFELWIIRDNMWKELRKKEMPVSIWKRTGQKGCDTGNSERFRWRTAGFAPDSLLRGGIFLNRRIALADI